MSIFMQRKSLLFRLLRGGPRFIILLFFSGIFFGSGFSSLPSEAALWAQPSSGTTTEGTQANASKDKAANAAQSAEEENSIKKEDSKKENALKNDSQKEASKDEGILSLIVRGGWTMLGLGLISTIILAFSMERFLYFRTCGLKTKGFQDRLDELLSQGGLDAAAETLSKEKGLLASIVAYGLAHQSDGADGVERALERRATVEIGKLERGLNLLANFGNLAPLLGFFGTVVGMRASFLQFVIQKAPTAQDLAGGVEEALITTAAGLLVAIPTYLIYNLFIYQIDNLSTEVEDAAARLRDAFSLNKRSAPPKTKKKVSRKASRKPAQNTQAPEPS